MLAKLGTTEKLVIYILSKKEWVPTRDLIELLSKARRSESAVRASLFRLKREGLVSSSKNGRETLFGLSEQGRQLLSSVIIRLAKADAKWEGGWLLLSFNIPEKKRALRTLLRDRLRSLGFGRLHANLWISPYDLREHCRKVVEELGVQDYVAVFMSTYADEDPRTLAYKAWDIENLAKAYSKLLRKYAKKLDEFQAKKFESEEQAGPEALLRILESKADAAGLAEKDPFLPRELLPQDWVGFELREVLTRYLQALYQRASYVADFDYLTKVGVWKS